ncbi:MAG TPA: extracellular solute-binding protein [Phototrophicaceae bacterium]|nr:extracellular solute-binding protein [Phototrophicaceae bacterium]
MKQKCIAFVLLVVLIVLPAQTRATAQQRVFWITYRSSTGPAGTSFAYALDQFQALHPDVRVEFTQEPDAQWRAEDQQFIESDDVPDIFEPNLGTGLLGTYVRAGFLTDLTPIASQRGWTGILNPTLQLIGRYDEQGIMGSGNLYGVATTGSFMGVYYNKNLFAQYGLDVPTSLEEFEQIADVFLAAGITPLTLGVADGLLDLNLYELMLYEADRAFVTNLQMFQGEVNFHGHDFTFGIEKLAEHFSRGYYGPDPLSVN